VEKTDPKSGGQYYVNRATKQKQWDMPESLKQHHHHHQQHYHQQQQQQQHQHEQQRLQQHQHFQQLEQQRQQQPLATTVAPTPQPDGRSIFIPEILNIVPRIDYYTHRKYFLNLRTMKTGWTADAAAGVSHLPTAMSLLELEKLELRSRDPDREGSVSRGANSRGGNNHTHTGGTQEVESDANAREDGAVSPAEWKYYKSYDQATAAFKKEQADGDSASEDGEMWAAKYEVTAELEAEGSVGSIDSMSSSGESVGSMGSVDGSVDSMDSMDRDFFDRVGVESDDESSIGGSEYDLPLLGKVLIPSPPSQLGFQDTSNPAAHYLLQQQEKLELINREREEAHRERTAGQRRVESRKQVHCCCCCCC
jgi:hypothetical protein